MGSISKAEQLEKLPLLTCLFPTAPTAHCGSSHGSVQIPDQTTDSFKTHNAQEIFALCRVAWAILLRSYTSETCVAYVTCCEEAGNETEASGEQEARGVLRSNFGTFDYVQYEIDFESCIQDVQPVLHLKDVEVSHLACQINTAVKLEISRESSRNGRPAPAHCNSIGALSPRESLKSMIESRKLIEYRLTCSSYCAMSTHESTHT